MKLNFSSNGSVVAGEWNERRRAMVRNTRIASWGVRIGFAVAVCVLGFVPSARALFRTDRPSAILVWPNILVGANQDSMRNNAIAFHFTKSQTAILHRINNRA